MPSYAPTSPKKTSPPTPPPLKHNVHGPLQKGITHKDDVINLIWHLPSSASSLINACNETLDPICLGHLADQNSLTETVEEVLSVANHSFVDMSPVFKKHIDCLSATVVELEAVPEENLNLKKMKIGPSISSFESGDMAALALVKEVERTSNVMVEELTTYSNILATTAVYQVFELNLAHQIYKCVLKRWSVMEQHSAHPCGIWSYLAKASGT
ncbi:hypothetical protein DXG01_016200 [Tephrocybe rancida]|nr:hypothetical protein DXG01_016200 [Tephrocybe rancida]